MSAAGKDLDGKVAIVTGAGVPGGMGAVTAQLLAAAGAKVVICDIATATLGDVASDLRAQGLEVSETRADIGDIESVQELIGFTVERYGRLDVLDNNAASNHLVPHDKALVDLPLDVWDGLFDVIARGTMLMCKHAIPEMIKVGGGSIINISSGKSLGGDLDEPSYSAAKAAVNSLTRTISVQYGKQGIRANTVSPGVILTALGKKILPEEQKATYTGIVNTPELGDPEDIGHLVVFLASDKSKYITGQLISVDGGFSTQNASVGLFRSLGEARHLNVVDAPAE